MVLCIHAQVWWQYTINLCIYTETCTNDLDWKCNPSQQAIVSCGNAGPFNYCFCDKEAVNGETYCIEDYSCFGAQNCQANSDCFNSFVCTQDSCCGSAGYCVPLCGEDADRRRLLIGEEEWKKYEESRKIIETRRRLQDEHICTNAYWYAQLITVISKYLHNITVFVWYIYSRYGNPGAKVEQLGIDNNDLSDNGLDNLNKTTVIELISINVITSVLCSLLVLCMVYICCLRTKQTVNKNEKGDKLKYNRVGGDVDNDEIDEMM